MRCQFCGWDNPEGKTHCEKCNKPLTETGSNPSAYDQAPHVRMTERQDKVFFNPRATVRENATTSHEIPRPSQDVCPECGFDLQDGECANCGYSSTKGDMTQKASKALRQKETDIRKTVRPQRKVEKERKFTLTPISEDSGMQEGEPIAFEGNSVNLTRNNTDPRNSTITSHTQATISCHDGEWSIEDKSEYKTTFVQAAGKIELRPGALILLGDQLYRFDN